MLRFAATAVSLFLAYCVAVVGAPLACVIFGIAWLIDDVWPREDDMPTSWAATLWIYSVAWSYIVIRLLFFPFVLLWCLAHGKPMPHPSD